MTPTIWFEPWELSMSSANLMSLPSIRDLLDLLSAAVKSFSMASLEKQLAAAQTLLCKNPPIDAAFLGQFKAGKSSFLNSLIHHDVLPVGAIPVTTAITRLQYGERENARWFAISMDAPRSSRGILLKAFRKKKKSICRVRPISGKKASIML
jgi:hypothetical protein